MGRTVVEKIISLKAGKVVHASELAIVNVDAVMATDSTAPLAIEAFHALGGKEPWNPQKVFLVIDHASPAPNERISGLHKRMRNFAAQAGCMLYDVGEGICHQLMVENRHVKPGDLFLGADSHTCTYGALNALAIGVGSTDLGAAMLTGKTWLKVPQTIRLELTGRLPRGISAKDLVLFLVGKVGSDGAIYKAVEFTGSAIQPLSLASRMTLANMAAEMGAKTGLVDPAGLDLPFAARFIQPDPDASYEAVHRYDISNLAPQISLPHSPDKVVSIDKIPKTRIDQAFIGSCTNSRLEDLHAAAAILKGKRVAAHVRLIVAPASRRVFNAALKDGTLQILSEAGASFITSGCGPCVGTHNGVPADGEAVISSTNRNFQGRMGNPKASIYLSSPAVVAASAIRGYITNPESLDGDAGEAWELF
jgi:3-isopropylmalate/(R)-2-methylmalate dehydratase large subunit